MKVEAGSNSVFHKFIWLETLCTTPKARVSLFHSIPRHSAGPSLSLLVGRLILDRGEEGSGILLAYIPSVSIFCMPGKSASSSKRAFQSDVLLPSRHPR
jgi:hypothetical protein